MCGRFTLAVDPADLQEAFPQFSFPAQFAPRYNIAPTQPVLAIPNDGKNHADFFSWGLIPMWAKDPSIGARMINARAETLAEKPAFRGALKYKRCIIPTSGFYEWKTVAGQKIKIPHFIYLKSSRPFALAGLWDEWISPEGSQIRSCTIITTEPNELMSTLHNRMPVILHPIDYAAWLDPAARKADELAPLLRPFPAEEMAAHPVSTLVNSPVNDRAECIVPVK
jgi:putative SOS response-associated peptidase YedK